MIQKIYNPNKKAFSSKPDYRSKIIDESQQLIMDPVKQVWLRTTVNQTDQN